MWGLLKSLEMVLLLGSIRQEAKKNDFLAESEETGKEFTQTDARNPELLRLRSAEGGHRVGTERGWKGGFIEWVAQLQVFSQGQVCARLEGDWRR